MIDQEGTLIAKTYRTTNSLNTAKIVLDISDTDINRWSGITTRNQGQIYTVKDETKEHIFVYSATETGGCFCSIYIMKRKKVFTQVG